MKHSRPTSSTGFTLLELSIVLTIIALVMGMSVTMGLSMINSAKRASTNSKLDVIEAALASYRMTYNRLPCPTDATLVEGSANFGYEAANAGSCTGGSPAANFTATIGSNGNAKPVAEGAVPVKTLGLPDEYQFDGWGRKIAYAVWAPITGAKSFVNYGIHANCGALTVKNAGAGNRTTLADYVLISYGPNGHGAYSKTGSRINAKSVNTDEQTNAHYDASGSDTGYVGTYVQKDATEDINNPLDDFDDIVRYRERWQMQNVYDTYVQSSKLPCTTGFRISGANSYDEMGGAVVVGDINGDGIPDLIIITGNGNGNIYVVFGTNQGFPDPLSLGSLNGTNGFEITGAYFTRGGAMAVGDVNGDGIPDLLISDLLDASDHGAVDVIFGRQSWGLATYTLDNNVTTGLLDGTHGFQISNAGGNSNDGFGYYGLAAGDINGDGISDIIAGTVLSTLDGAVYVVYGGSGPKSGGAWAASYNTTVGGSLYNGTNGFRIHNGVHTSEEFGGPLITADINGDGVADIIAGAANGGTGKFYVIYGNKTAWASDTVLSTLINGTKGVQFTGENSGDAFGWGLAIGDVNGDGIPDIIAGASYASPNGVSRAGSVYVIFGTGSNWATSNSMALGGSIINGTNGFRIDGTSVNQYIGFNVAVGDVNGDGYADIITSGYNLLQNVYSVFGASSFARSNYTLDNNVTTGIVDGISNGFYMTNDSGFGISTNIAVGDINGDGMGDIVVGSYWDSNSGKNHNGAAFVLFGRYSGWTNNLSLPTL